MTIQIRFGNETTRARRLDASGEWGGEWDLYDEPRVTSFTIPDTYSLGEAFVAVTAPDGMWANHSHGSPTWVESNHAGMEALLADHFGCPVGAPADVEATHHTVSGPPGVGPDGPIVSEGADA